MSWIRLIQDFSSLFFPGYCGGCRQLLGREEAGICTTCLMRLPRTRMHDHPDNRAEKLLWGRANVLFASAFLHMPRKGLTHQLIHELKYRGNQQVGETLGRAFGHELTRSSRMHTFDLLLPVPLHPRKEFERGYNQCHASCRGMQEAMGIPWADDLLVKREATESQTRRNRFDRWRNTHTVYEVTRREELAGRHVLLVDDVITTGATFEACCQAMAGIPGTGVSVAALALPVYR
jgi:ComF family protein